MMKTQLKKSAMQKKQTKGGTMRLKREHHEKSTLDRKPKRLKNVDSIKSAFIFVLGSQKSIFPDCPLLILNHRFIVYYYILCYDGHTMSGRRLYVYT